MSKTLDLLLDIDLPISVSFGHCHVSLKDILSLKPGDTIDLEIGTHHPVELIVNHSIVAQGQLVVVGENYGVRIEQIITLKERLHTLN